MAYYKDTNNLIYWLQENEDPTIWIPVAVTAITDDEAATMKAQARAAKAPALLQASAKQALSTTDSVAVRCIKANVPFPADWQEYVTALRNIANKTDTTSTQLPVQPAYPAGT